LQNDRFAVWVAESTGGLKEAEVHWYSPGGANVPTWEGSAMLCTAVVHNDTHTHMSSSYS